MADLTVPWQLVALVEAPALGALFGLVLHTRKLIADQRVALADYKTRVAERYVPFAVQDASRRRSCAALSASRTSSTPRPRISPRRSP